MKHWDERDVADVEELRLPRPEEARLAEMLATRARPRREPVHVGSMIGLALALAVLAGLAWVLTPADPVSPTLLR